jgi:hypothetical protein
VALGCELDDDVVVVEVLLVVVVGVGLEVVHGFVFQHQTPAFGQL